MRGTIANGGFEEGSEEARLWRGPMRLALLASLATLVASILWCSTRDPRSASILDPLVSLVERVIPSVGNIAMETDSPRVSEVVLALQWPFFPVYAALILRYQPPWNPRYKLAARQRLVDAPAKTQLLIVLMFPLIAIGYMLGLLGLIGFPTFLNGKYVYPHSQTFGLFQHITDSWSTFAAYAWIGPLLDAYGFYFFVAFVFLYRDVLNVVSQAARER